MANREWIEHSEQAGRITLTRGPNDRGSIAFEDGMPSKGRWTGHGDGAILTIESGPQRGYCYNECGELVSR